MKIENKKHALNQHPFIHWMSSTNENPLSFAPAMTFFVLGFKDVLNYLKRSNPATIWDHVINIHCEEEANHWIWFIEDLQKIGLQKTSWGSDFSELLKSTWSQEGIASRDMIYSTIHMIKQTDDPFIHLAMIESLEAAFAAFISALLPQIEQRGWQSELRYFGSRHHNDESNHALGSWVVETDMDRDLENAVLTEDQKMKALASVKSIFEKFDSLFSSWFNQKGLFITNNSINNLYAKHTKQLFQIEG